jgi:CheY-like chemotaxis protein
MWQTTGTLEAILTAMPSNPGVNMSPSQEIFLICYPADETFESGVMTTIDGLGGLGRSSVESVELKLHERFPDLRIVVHKPLDSDEWSQTTWIVFRDRHELTSHARQRHGPTDSGRSPAERRSSEQPTQARQVGQPVALVVDDEPLVLMLISMILTARGWRVIQASNGDSALARAAGVELDLLVTDYEMPGMNGRTLAHRLCENDPNLPVLVVSGRPEESDWTEGARHGFLEKPFAIEALADRVESLTGYATAWTSSNRSGGG